MEFCGRFLSAADYELLSSSKLDPQPVAGRGLPALFHQWECSLRNELARLRSVDSEPPEADVSPVFGTSQIAAGAMEQNDPLEAELYLDDCRWSEIDELSAGHSFDMEFLCAYRLKLQILERHTQFEQERGSAAYQDLYARLLSAPGIGE